MNDELKKLVDMSNVEAVEAAIDAKEEAEKNARKEIEQCKNEAYNSVRAAEAEKALVEQEKQKELACIKKSRKTAWTALICTLACCIITDTAFCIDLWNFVSGHVTNVIEIVKYIMAAGLEEDSLTVCVFITIFTAISNMLVLYLLYRLVKYYRKKWSPLSLKILVISFSMVIVFSDLIKKAVNINLVVLFFLIQIGYTLVMGYIYMSRQE